MTMERAISVANCLDVCPLLKERANKALDSLNTKRDKVKSVKDELQRAVMECRHEAITCAIAEAESLPYFLTFDPLDGQISAILEYARNKIAPHNSPSDAGEGRSPVQRVKSNLKRAMRGNSYLKLESAINLYRTTYNIGEKGERVESGKQLTPEEEENLLLIRRAERRCRRMKREERVAEREWKQTRNMLRENLRSAMKEKDRAELWKAVYQFKRKMGSSLDKEDETLLAEARKHLREVTILQVKTNLSNALVDRDSTRLKHSLGELDSPSLTMFPVTMDVNFRGEVTRAKKLLGHLKEMDRLRKSVAEMSRSQLAEIHRYPSPPACVRAVMIATYILLGEKEKELKDWTAVMRLLVKMGRESLTRRVAICVPIHIPAAAAHRAKEILSEWTIQQVQDISKVAAVFFAWSRCTVSEVFDRHESGDGERPIPSNKPPRQVDKQKEMPKDPVKSEFWNRLSRPRSSAPVTRPLRSFRMNHMRPTSALK